jgi:hypothetical protein
MPRAILLLVLTFAGSAICWWPAIIEPSIDFSRWILLALIALMAGASTALSGGRWLLSVVACALGSFAGLLIGIVIWPSHDGIANTYSGIALVIGTFAAVATSLLSGLIVFAVTRKRPISNVSVRWILWSVLLASVAFGPVMMALTPPLVARRVARNDTIAEQRFTALKRAVEETWAEAADGEGRICDGRILKAHYSGPEFSDQDWSRIAGNYVERDGYVYMVYCHETSGYTIDVQPKQPADYGYGSHSFCTDESKRIGCGLVYHGSRNACKPCDS